MVGTPKSEALAALHENVTDLYRIGLISKKVMRRFDVACLIPVRKSNPAALRRVSSKTNAGHGGDSRTG